MKSALVTFGATLILSFFSLAFAGNSNASAKHPESAANAATTGKANDAIVTTAPVEENDQDNNDKSLNEKELPDQDDQSTSPNPPKEVPDLGTDDDESDYDY